MEELVRFLRERLGSKVFLPYVLFFLTYNWPLLVYLFVLKDGRSAYVAINGYFESRCAIEYLGVPAITALLCVWTSPWINFLVEKYLVSAPNIQRKMLKIDEDLKIENKRKEQAQAEIVAADLERSADEKGILNKDKDIYEVISSKVIEKEINEALSSIRASPYDNNDFLKYMNRALSILTLADNKHYNKVVRASQDSLIISMRALVAFVEKNKLKKSVDTLEVVRGFSPGDREHFNALVDRVIDSYLEYRTSVRDELRL